MERIADALGYELEWDFMNFNKLRGILKATEGRYIGSYVQWIIHQPDIPLILLKAIKSRRDILNE